VSSSGQDLVESAVKRVTGTFGSAVTVEAAGDLAAVVIEKGKLRDLLFLLKGEKDLAFTLLMDLFPVDCHGREPRFEIVYLLTSVEKNARLVVKTRIGDGESVPTVSDIFAAANAVYRRCRGAYAVVAMIIGPRSIFGSSGGSAGAGCSLTGAGTGLEGIV